MRGDDPQDATTPLDWHGGVAQGNGVDIVWEEAGPVGGEPLLLVMGLAGQLIHWPDMLCRDLVARGFRVIRFDNRDIGLSGDSDRGVRFSMPVDWWRSRQQQPVRANYTLHDMAADVVGLLDALAVDRANVAGVSMGGMIAQLLAAQHGSRVRSLTSIMSSTNDPRLPPPRPRVLWHMSGIGQPKDHSREAVLRRYVKLFRMIGSPAYPTPESELRQRGSITYDRSYRPAGMLRQTHAILATGSIEPLLERIEAPTQIVHGLADPLLRPACGRRSAQLISGSRLELIPGMGHDLPKALMPRLAELIAGNAARV